MHRAAVCGRAKYFDVPWQGTYRSQCFGWTRFIVAAGTEVPPDAAIGPNSSAWEAGDADEANRDLASSRIPVSHWVLNVLLGLPIQGVALFIGALPWLIVLAILVYQEPAFVYADPLR